MGSKTQKQNTGKTTTVHRRKMKSRLFWKVVFRKNLAKPKSKQ